MALYGFAWVVLRLITLPLSGTAPIHGCFLFWSRMYRSVWELKTTSRLEAVPDRRSGLREIYTYFLYMIGYISYGYPLKSVMNQILKEVLNQNRSGGFRDYPCIQPERRMGKGQLGI